MHPPAQTPTPVTLETFDACAIPLAEWNHRAHLTIAYLFLRAHNLEEATARMRTGVKKYNAANGIAQTPAGGYHETLTVAWMRILHAVMSAHGHADTTGAFFDQHPHLLSKVLLRLYYTRPRIMSHQARHGWVDPDLAPLPGFSAPPAPPGQT